MTECSRESEVLDMLARGSDVDPRDLREHLASCASCGEMAGIAAALGDDHRAALREAHVPDAGSVWWRATIRARAEAARTVSQPITVAQGIAGACTIGLASALATAIWRWLPYTSVADLAVGLETRRDEIAAASALVLQHALPLALGLAACLVIAPLALYLALADD
jgi:hypothetical protein